MSDAITLVKNAIHNPADARHFMRIATPDYRITATIGHERIADSRRVLKVKEVGRDIYDPVLYFPREDVAMTRLRKNIRTTHCPLKGDTEYFDAVIGEITIADVGWSYVRTIERAAALQGYIAFDPRYVHLVEHTVEDGMPE